MCSLQSCCTRTLPQTHVHSFRAIVSEDHLPSERRQVIDHPEEELRRTITGITVGGKKVNGYFVDHSEFEAGKQLVIATQ